MAKLFMSMAGEGRGHATRAAALLPALVHRHEVTLFAPETAYRLLHPIARRLGAPIQRIPGLTNRYDKNGHWSYVQTFAAGATYLRRLPHLVSALADRIAGERPDLVITDFEPALPRAAQRCDLPYVSISHQHFMLVNDLSCLPATLRYHATVIGRCMRHMYERQARTIVSSFFQLPIKPQFDNVQQVGVLLRPGVLSLTPRSLDHVVVYLRRHAPSHVLEALSATKMRTIVYGLGERPSRNNLVFKAIDHAAFIEDLASSQALICTAGNQIVGEALYFGKPVLSMPEPGNFEQSINAHFVEKMAVGRSVPLERCDENVVARFMGSLPCYPAALDRRRLNGIPRILEILDQQLRARKAPPEQPAALRVA